MSIIVLRTVTEKITLKGSYKSTKKLKQSTRKYPLSEKKAEKEEQQKNKI